MMAMADMMAVVVMADTRISGRGEVMIGVTGIMKIMVFGLHADRMRIATTMPMHAHRRRPGELERNDQKEDQGNQAAHCANANAMRARRTTLTKAVSASKAMVTDSGGNHRVAVQSVLACARMP